MEGYSWRFTDPASGRVPIARNGVDHGPSSVFQAVPALNQYWHPWLLGGVARGTAVVGYQTWELDGWPVYGEKNWGRGGSPDDVGARPLTPG